MVASSGQEHHEHAFPIRATRRHDFAHLTHSLNTRPDLVELEIAPAGD
jgi:hypothetical protein